MCQGFCNLIGSQRNRQVNMEEASKAAYSSEKLLQEKAYWLLYQLPLPNLAAASSHVIVITMHPKRCSSFSDSQNEHLRLKHDSQDEAGLLPSVPALGSHDEALLGFEADGQAALV